MSATDDTLLPSSPKQNFNRNSDETVLPPDSTSTLSAGGIIAGRFQLLAPLGSGGMAEVWSARDQLLNIDIAVKLPARHLAREKGFVDVLLEEARTAIRISGESRRFVGVRDIHIDPQFGPVLIMELVSWPTLRTWLDTDMPGWDKTPRGSVPIIKEMTQAVADLHHLGILHRDLKPENVFITCIENEWHVKLVDFGLSRAIDEQTRTTVRGAMSAYYVGPEILRGQEATPASDVYALGVMFYEMLAGEKPVGRYDELSDLIPDFPAELETIIDRCLDPKPQRRPQTAIEVLLALDEFTSSSGVLAKIPLINGNRIEPEPTPIVVNVAQVNDDSSASIRPPSVDISNETITVKEAQVDESIIEPLLGDKVDVSFVVQDLPPDRRLDRTYSWAEHTYKSELYSGTQSNFAFERGIELLGRYVSGMACIPEGTIQIGSQYIDAAKPVHNVTLREFHIGTTPVTVAMWREYCSATGREMPDEPEFGWKDECPVINVSWNDIVGRDGRGGYCEWASTLLGMRITLPTEAQWEYCCRVDGHNEYPWGSEFNPSLLVWKGNAYGTTAPVNRSDRLFRTKQGLMDLIGNVWEWCLDDYQPYTEEHLDNPTAIGGSEHRCLRGGSWENNGYAIRFRSAYRAKALTNSRHPAYGFRLAIDNEYW